MLKKEIELKKHIKINTKFDIDSNYDFNHELLRKVSNLKIIGTLDYQETIKSLIIQATIFADIQAIDARDGKIIELFDQKYDWSDEYYFENTNNVQTNVVFGEEFNLLDYAIEQIVLNIPMNLSINYGKISFVGKDYIVMSEEEYQQEQENQVDPRWEKLKDFNFNKE